MIDPDATPAERLRLARLFGDLVAGAGALAMETLARPEIAATLKHDRSPVTEADERVEAFLLDALARDLPGVPVVAEESAARGETPTQAGMARGGAFLLVDPIDGTREFLSRSGEFTINVALIVDRAPVVGAIAAPAQGRVWFAGGGCFAADAPPGGRLPAPQDWRALRARQAPRAGLTALVSRSHLDAQTIAFVARLPVTARMSVGSSLKFCTLAEGAADVYPRFGPTMEWDTAAGDAILRAAGGATLDALGAPLLYGKARDNYRNGPFVAWGDPAAATLS